ncbi:MAG: hypothetical protein ACXAB2_14140 [Candidatus Hodarchaeales archaeon]|jgi:hypothetical protein
MGGNMRSELVPLIERILCLKSIRVWKSIEIGKYLEVLIIIEDSQVQVKNDG